MNFRFPAKHGKEAGTRLSKIEPGIRSTTIQAHTRHLGQCIGQSTPNDNVEEKNLCNSPKRTKNVPYWVRTSHNTKRRPIAVLLREKLRHSRRTIPLPSTMEYNIHKMSTSEFYSPRRTIPFFTEKDYPAKHDGV